VRHIEAPPASDMAPINLKKIRLLQAMMIAPESPYRSPVPALIAPPASGPDAWSHESGINDSMRVFLHGGGSRSGNYSGNLVVERISLSTMNERICRTPGK
jgi:hypothetical protein